MNKVKITFIDTQQYNFLYFYYLVDNEINIEYLRELCAMENTTPVEDIVISDIEFI